MSIIASNLGENQRHARDLAALLALQGVWRGRGLPYIAGTLLDALVSLLRLDLAWFRLEDPQGRGALQDLRPLGDAKPDEVGDALLRALDVASAEGTVTDPRTGERLRAMRHDAIIDRENGIVIACSHRPDFPTQVERFLLRTAMEQGMVALQGARLLRDLQEANNAKAAFLATMSHELRTPLNAILGHLDLLDAEVPGPLNEQQRQNVARIAAGARHLMQLIEGILSFARVQAGKEEVQRESVDLNRLVRDTAALVEPLLRARNLRFDVALPEQPVRVMTDGSKVRQILLNLLSNAAKFTGEGGVVAELVNEGDEVALRVRDSGVGIPASEQQSIFEPFRQLGDVYTKTSSGTGLGLSVSRHLATLLGGTLTVESEPGKGSTFTLRLPGGE